MESVAAVENGEQVGREEAEGRAEAEGRLRPFGTVQTAFGPSRRELGGVGVMEGVVVDLVEALLQG